MSSIFSVFSTLQLEQQLCISRPDIVINILRLPEPAQNGLYFVPLSPASTEFRGIPWKRWNSVVTGRFRDLAQSSAFCRKLWSLINHDHEFVIAVIHCSWSRLSQQINRILCCQNMFWMPWTDTTFSFLVGLEPLPTKTIYLPFTWTISCTFLQQLKVTKSHCPHSASDWRPVCFWSHFPNISSIFNWPSLAPLILSSGPSGGFYHFLGHCRNSTLIDSLIAWSIHCLFNCTFLTLFGCTGDKLYYTANAQKRLELMSNDEQQHALREAHDCNGAHQGQKRTMSRLTQDFYWYTMTDDVKKWVCISSKLPLLYEDVCFDRISATQLCTNLLKKSKILSQHALSWDLSTRALPWTTMKKFGVACPRGTESQYTQIFDCCQVMTFNLTRFYR